MTMPLLPSTDRYDTSHTRKPLDMSKERPNSTPFAIPKGSPPPTPRGRRPSTTVWRFLFWVQAVMLAAISLMPDRTITAVGASAARGHDELIHVMTYVPLGLAFVLGYSPHARPRTARFALALSVCTGYGFLLETLQAAWGMLHRSFSIGDILANGIGASCGALFALLWSSPRRSKSSPRSH